MEVETAALANYTCSVWESSHKLSFTAALTIDRPIPYNTSPGSMHTPPHYVLHCTTRSWLLPSSYHGKLYLNMCSVKLPGGVVSMNNVILTKWRYSTKH